MSHKDEYIEIGRILKPFGIKGALKIRFYIDDVSDLKGMKTFYVKDKRQQSGFKTLTVSSLKFETAPEFARVTFNEIADRTQAEIWRLIPIFVLSQDLNNPQDGQYFIKDILDTEAFHNEKKIGLVYNIISVGNQEVFVIKQLESKQDLAVPFTDKYVDMISIKEKRIYFRDLDELM